MDALSVAERRNKIIEILNENGRVNVNDLSDSFGVSGVIIRADLSELEKQGLLTRVHGGAVTNYKSYYDMSLMQRLNTNAEEKERIAEKVSQIIRDNDTLMMNAGTTLLFVMRKISNKKLTIVTNSIALALEGAKNPNFKIILLGGDVDSSYQFTYGVSVINSLRQYSADLFIMSVDGIDTSNGVSTFYHQEAEICRSMIKHSSRTIIAADHTKIGRKAFVKIESLNEIDAVFTNKNADSIYLDKIKQKGIEIVLSE